MEYKIKKTLLGKSVVSYSCGHCRSSLESPIEEAGTTQPCPNCEKSLVTPGSRELDEMRREESERKKREEQQRLERLQEKHREEKAAAAHLKRQQIAKDEQIVSEMVGPEMIGPPDYLGLSFGAGAFRVIGGLSIVSGLFSCVVALTNIAGPPLLYGITVVALGFILIAAGSACDALRDIARNSFPKPTKTED